MAGKPYNLKKFLATTITKKDIEKRKSDDKSQNKGEVAVDGRSRNKLWF